MELFTGARDALEQIYLDKKSKNKAYSMRAYARDLGVSQALLSLTLAGKREVSKNLYIKIRALSNHASLGQTPPSPFYAIELQSDHETLLTQWYHLPLLDLLTVKGAKSDPASLAARLGISVLEVSSALHRLERLGLIEKKAGGYTKLKQHLEFVPKASFTASRAYHRAMLDRVQTLIDRNQKPEDMEARHLTGSSLAIDSKKIPEAKKRIEKFKRELISFLTKDDGNEVFQFQMQLFPITKPLKGDRK